MAGVQVHVLFKTTFHPKSSGTDRNSPCEHLKKSYAMLLSDTSPVPASKHDFGPFGIYTKINLHERLIGDFG